LTVLLLPLVLGSGWKSDVAGKTIDPRYVQRLKNGVTTKHEILLYFGEPQEIIRTPEGPIFKYASYKDASALPKKLEARQPLMEHQESSSRFYLDEKKQIKKPAQKKEPTELRSTLTIRFKPDGETMMSFEYKEY
jgi:hypothetical protein